MTTTMHLTITKAILSAFLIPIIIVVLRPRRRHGTQLKGPSSKGFLFGYSEELFRSSGYIASDLIEKWEALYGSAFHVPAALGVKHLVLCDLKGFLHLYSNDTYAYRQTRSTRYAFETIFGRNLFWAEADTHKRQRKALSPAFSNSAIRDLTSVFYDSAYVVKSSWDSLLQSSSGDNFVVDVQKWMGHVTLDTIGMAGFSHDFGSLKGKSPPVVTALDSFGTMKTSIASKLIFLLAQKFPPLIRIPTKRLKKIKTIIASIGVFASAIIESARAGGETEASSDKSIIGTLVKSESVTSESLRMTNDEIMAQFLFIIAGYETVSITLTWALIELCRHPKIQQKLRDEQAQFSTEDPTWEQLTNDLPFLDAVVCEILRIHPIGLSTIREAHVDDVIPLSKPIRTADGQVVDSIFVAKGTIVHVPIMMINRSEALWGGNAKDFVPSRWLDDSISREKASEIQGYRHLLTFGGGHRACLGRTFALTEIKVVLSVLIRNYTFELPNGPSTKFGSHRSLLERPKVAGEDGPRVPLIIRRVE